MLIQKNSCVGLDCTIQKFQSFLYKKLVEIWGDNWDCFPRIYKNTKRDEDGKYVFIPEYLDGIKEYTTDVLFNDNVNVTSFFFEQDVSKIDNQIITTKVSLIFSCKIDKIYDGAEKQDEKMKRDIYNVIVKYPTPNFELTDIKKTVGEVYKEFDIKRLKYSDMSNRHLLRFDFDVTYHFNC